NLLDELQLSDHTLVVFSSDNGTTHLDQEVDFTFFKSVGELRGLKGSLYEGGVRVPTLARWPGHIKAGSESSRVSGFEDWLPTIMEVVGGADRVPKDVDGISLLPTLLGKDQPERPFLYREFGGYGGQQTIRVGKWKAVRQNLRKGTVRTELYDMESDVGEQHDVAAEHP
ncbi:MAG: sulfatase-like hydrolase/transferase, partial [Planctomycetales bacterium]|nr:sulfatase-like hydrolase/transferase [Planctomycetales bacterium]